MKITRQAWDDYISLMGKLCSAAADDVTAYMDGLTAQVKNKALDADTATNMLISYAHGIVTKYAEASSALACEMYDAVAALSGKSIAPAEPADTPDMQEVAKTVNGTKENTAVLANAVGRLVKRAGADTVLKNAQRDGAEVAWIPHGDTCAFCIALASRGWESVSAAGIEDGHAKHIHANCNCEYGVRFDKNTRYDTYDPTYYEKMYYGADGKTAKDRINAMRRSFYAENREKILAQKADAYEKRKELNASAAEEMSV